MSGGLALLERAIGYTLGSLDLVTPDALPLPTPCQGWDLAALLSHMNDSLLALCEAADLGWIALDPVGDDPTDPVATLRERGCRLLGAWTNAERDRTVSVAGRPLAAEIVAGAGALEVAVHGWDVARACRVTRPLPPALARELLELAPLLVTGADRLGRFAPPIAVSPAAGPGDQLLAFLGRNPL
ncbi:TIGR03086 family metal-binding protein [Saccharomonospora sp. NPDC046836]|uniref:TIGR03086 family metal-binding protein n=1 Tax=Saccharomonospora sp. NPDC046836 TaxID=3156921 RepID=UPI0033EB6A02